MQLPDRDDLTPPRNNGELWLIVVGVGVFYLWLTLLAFALPLWQ
jgi:hypothetical protein